MTYDVKNLKFPAQRLEWAIKRKFKYVSDFARAIDGNEVTIRSHVNGNRNFDIADAKVYAQVLDVPWFWLMAETNNLDSELLVLPDIKNTPKVVPLVGNIGIGAMGHDYDTHELVEAPPGYDGIGPLVAREIKGDALFPMYVDGENIYYAPQHGVNEEECLNQKCVLKVLGGEIYLKILLRGSKPNTYTLMSLNNSSKLVEDVQIEWASLIRGSWLAKKKDANRI